MSRTVALPSTVLAAALALGLAGGLVHASPAKPGAQPTVTVDLNTATVEDLAGVPGIGQALASRIVELREKEGPFRRVEDLLKVKGIGEKSLEKLRPYVKVGKGS
jgi:competence protein ComEA